VETLDETFRVFHRNCKEIGKRVRSAYSRRKGTGDYSGGGAAIMIFGHVGNKIGGGKTTKDLSRNHSEGVTTKHTNDTKTSGTPLLMG